VVNNLSFVKNVPMTHVNCDIIVVRVSEKCSVRCSFLWLTRAGSFG
jgi:hypothetical protein